MSRRRRPAIPRIPLSADRETSSFFKAVKEALEIAIGDRGDVLDSNPTWRDLVDADIASAANAAYNRGSVGGAVLPDALTPYEDQTIPPAPTNVSVTATTGNVYITYDQPAGTYISHAEIYHAEVEAADPAPAVGDAVFLGRGYLIGVFQHSVEPVSRHFYWVRFVSYAGKYGPWHNLAGSEITAPQDPAAYLTLLTDQIDASHLSAILESRIDLIDAPSTGLVDGLAQEILDRSSGDSNLQGQITTINSTLNHGTTGLAATYTKATTAETKADTADGKAEANTTDITSINASLNHGTTGLAATYSKAVAAETVANTADGKADVNSAEILAARGGEGSLDARLQVMSSVSTDLGALWTVTQDVNGYVTGFGIYNTGATSLARFNVAQFAIASPGASELSFVVDGTNVVMNGAFIQDATITSAKINNVTVDKITGDTANFVLTNIGTGNITNAMIGNTIQSTAYVPGASGWHINKLGSAELNDLIIHDPDGRVAFATGQNFLVSTDRVTDDIPITYDPEFDITTPYVEQANGEVPTEFNFEREGGGILSTGTEFFDNRVYKHPSGVYLHVGAVDIGYTVSSTLARTMTGSSLTVEARLDPVNGSRNYELIVLEYDSEPAAGVRFLSETNTNAETVLATRAITITSSTFSLLTTIQGNYTPTATAKYYSVALKWATGGGADAVQFYHMKSTGTAAQVSTTYISDAAITEAKIGEAAVGTLKIAGNAISVTQVAEFADGAISSGLWGQIGTFSFNHGHSEDVLTLIDAYTVLRNYDGVSRGQFRLQVNGANYDSIEFELGSPVFVGTIYSSFNQSVPFRVRQSVLLPPGDNTVTLFAKGATIDTNGCRWYDSSVTAQAAKR